ncbi:MAG: transposase, partial [Lachnospiraceae bacterium]|nr:transposase [Lachnospiraceae bacterium]
LKASIDDLSEMMRWLNSSYALFFNSKYGRLWYVFADRFRSENIEDKEYFYKCIRYVHQN